MYLGDVRLICAGIFNYFVNFLPCLVALVNASFQPGVFHEALKTASVIPLLKMKLYM